MEAICLHDILKDIASRDSDLMYAATSKPPFPGPPTAREHVTSRDVDEWGDHTHETPSLLFFARREERAARELSELLTRKFREYFP